MKYNIKIHNLKLQYFIFAIGKQNKALHRQFSIFTNNIRKKKNNNSDFMDYFETSKAPRYQKPLNLHIHKLLFNESFLAISFLKSRPYLWRYNEKIIHKESLYFKLT